MLNRLRLACVTVVAAAFGVMPALEAQIINTYAGGVIVEGQPATSTPLNLPRGIGVDRQGNLYIAETGVGLIRKVDTATGIATILAGGGTQLDDARPIPGRQALLDGPTFPAVDGLGNVYFCDTNNHRVRKITPDGMITTVVGTGLPGFSGDSGPATRAQLNSPEGLYVDAIGNVFVSDSGNGRVRMVAEGTGGVIQTVVGGGTGGEGARALEVRLGSPRGITQDPQGNIVVLARGAFGGRNRILRVDRTSGIVTTVAGGGDLYTGAGFDNTVPTDPKTIDLCGSISVVVDQGGAVYFDNCGSVIRINPADGLMRLYFGAPGSFGGDPVSERAGVVFQGHRVGLVYRIEGQDRGRVVAGTTEPFDGLFATAAPLSTPLRVAVDGSGNLYIGDDAPGRIRRVDARTGIISTLITNTNGMVHVNRTGNLFFESNGLKKLDLGDGQLTTLIPGRFPSQLQDGMRASEAGVSFIRGIAADVAGNIYFGQAGPPPNLHGIWMLETSTGLVRLIAGNGIEGGTGDGGLARNASVSVNDIALDNRGNLLIAHPLSGRLRQVNLATGIISSIPVDLGSGQWGVTVDARDNVYVSASHIDSVGVLAGGRFSIIAGTRQRGFLGDGGIPTLARLSAPNGLAVDAAGSLYIADTGNARVRKVTAVTVTPVLAVRPTTLVFTARQGQPAPSPQAVTVTGGNLIPLAWNAEISTDRGGNWLAVSPNSGTAPASVFIAVNPAGLAPGTYQGAINMISSGASGSPQTIPVTLNVLSTNPPAIGLSQQFLSFTALQGGASPPSQTVSLTNTGGGALNFAVQTETSGGGSWLQVTTSSGMAPATLTVRANSTGLAPGLYQGLITIRETATNELRTIAVSLLVSRAVPILQVSQTGLLFLGVEGSLTLRPQTLIIQNRGQGVMNWRVQASVAGAGDWLRVTPDRGSSDAANPLSAPAVTVTVEPTQLRAGIFSGLLTITADGAPNSPFVVLVLVNILPAGTEPVGLIQPAGLIFTTPAGSAAPLTQEVTVSTTGGRQLQFLAGVRTQSGGNWLSLSPTSGTLLGSTESVRLQLTANPSGLAAGVYLGALTVSFGNGVVQDVAIALVVTSGVASGAAPHAGRDAASQQDCTPSRIVMVETQLVQNFRSNLGWPTPLLAQIVNDCAQRISDATVLVSFSNGDASIVLANLRNGLYSGTWVPAATATQVTVTLNALHAALGPATVRLGGSLASAETPLVFPNGAVNGASFRQFAPLPVGTIFSIFGRNLERAPAGATQLPLPRRLGDISAKLGDIDLPLIFAGPGQINAQVPYELPPGTTASLVIKKGDVFTTPEVVTIVPAQPAVFSVNQSGTGQGAILDAQFRLAGAANPVAAGDVVQIYATGLGATNPPATTGAAAPDPPARVVLPVTVTIAGREAAVEFAGLAPGFVGLYQVNARVPAGITAGNTVPVVLSQGGIASNTVTIAVRQ